MFGKKFLNFVALLLVGSQINSAFAAVADLGISTNCASFVEDGFDVNSCSGTATSNCKTTDGIIYGVTEASGCAASPLTLVANSVNIVDMSSGLALANLESDISSLVGGSKIGIVICGATSCKQTFGYIKTSEVPPKYYRIGADGTNEAVVSGDAVTTVGVLNPDNYKLNIADGNSVDFISGNNDAADYLLPKASASGVFMTSDAVEALGSAKTHIMIKAVSDTFVFDNVFDDEQFCVLTSSLVMSRIDNFCSGSSFDSLYSCNGGICVLSESFVEAGKYIVENNLYVCTVSSPNVVCTIDDGTNDGIHVFQVYNDANGDTLVKLTDDLTSADLGSEKYQIFDCKLAVCTRTSGYIKYGAGSNSTGRCPSGTDCAAQAGEDTIGFTGNAGALKFTGSAFTYTVEGDSAKDVATGNDYFFVDGDSQYDYISFESTSIVALAKNVGNDVYITSATNVVGNGAENCNSNTYHHYVIKSSTEVDSSSAQCETPNEPCPLSDNSVTNGVKCPNGYYLKATDDGALANAAEAGTIYKCVDQSCKVLDDTEGYEFVYGIVPNADALHKVTVPYIACVGTASCTAIVKSDGVDCSRVAQGGIISPEPNVYALCVVGNSDTGGVTITTVNTDKFILPITVFNSNDISGKFVMVSFDGTKVIKDVSNNKKYNYTGADNKIYSKSESAGICAAKVYEYTKNEHFEYTKTDEKPKA